MLSLLQPRVLLSDRLRSGRETILAWLRLGTEPRQLAFTLALGFAIGCIPLLGVTTGICAVLAILFRLNMPAIQAANWLAMPLQVVLLLPFLRLGQWIFRGHGLGFGGKDLLARIESAPWQATLEMSSLFAHAVLAWVITAGPALLLMTLVLTPVMHRMSKLTAESEPLDAA